MSLNCSQLSMSLSLSLSSDQSERSDEYTTARHQCSEDAEVKTGFTQSVSY